MCLDEYYKVKAALQLFPLPLIPNNLFLQCLSLLFKAALVSALTCWDSPWAQVLKDVVHQRMVRNELTPVSLCAGWGQEQLHPMHAAVSNLVLKVTRETNSGAAQSALGAEEIPIHVKSKTCGMGLGTLLTPLS